MEFSQKTTSKTFGSKDKEKTPAPSEALTRTQTYETGNYPSTKKPTVKTQKEDQGENEKEKRAVVTDEATGTKRTYSYNAQKIVGNGTFGVVFQATVQETGEIVAIKKVFQDKRYRNREYQILKELNHPNVTVLRNAFYTQGDNKPDEIYLNVVMDYVPETIAKITRYYRKMKQSMPIILIKLYSYQLLRALVYIKELGICHRDIKPQNVLVNPSTHQLKLCDFGSAKRLVKGEPNIAYICSRYYRAPELIFGATEYGFEIDMWSTGCVIAEMILGEPLFPGDSGIDQLVEIIKVLGTPTSEQVLKMNPASTEEFKFPQIKPQSLSKVFKKTDPLLIDLLSKILVYDPKERLTPVQALTHSFFNDLRNQSFQIQGCKISDLFDFTPEEIKAAGTSLSLLIPSWYKKPTK